MTDLLESTENRITTLTLNRPERLNALSPAMTAGLKETLERLSTDRDCGAIVITGAGRGWCAGGDVKTMETRGEGQTFEDRVEGLRRAHQLPLLMRSIPKIIIGMINGPVAGAGLGLALACDLRIAGKSARFGTAFARIGYSGDYGGSWSLTRLVGTAKARELYFLADVIDADKAGELGMVNRVVPLAELREKSLAYARRLSLISPEALYATKLAINRGADAAGFTNRIHIGLDVVAPLYATKTEFGERFREIVAAEGVPAAVRWRAAQFKE